MDSIEYYNKYAAKVFEDTADQNMDDIIKVFLEELEEGNTILDLGCGSGRDSLTFYESGYDVTALDASEEMCKLAEIHTGLDVLHMTYENMSFEDVFDGIWACASLIHVPGNEIQSILIRIARALKERGVLYMSFKQGEYEGFRGERYFCEYTEKTVEQMVKESGRFDILKLWVSEDVRSGHAQSQWLNVLLRKK